MKKERKNKYDDDDGRVIAPMNIDGMPWYSGNHKLFGNKQPSEQNSGDIQLTPKETRAMLGGVFAAALLVAGVFALAALLFILFCVYVWLK